jgi:hypothetical protein
MGYGNQTRTEQKFESDASSEGGIRVALGDRMMCHEEKDGIILSDALE